MSIVRCLEADYGDFQIRIPYWEILDRGVTALTGPSGSGKSTVIRLLLGLEKAPLLSWIMDGVDIARLPVEQRGLGVVFQTYELFPHLTAEQNILFAARARRLDAAAIKESVNEFKVLLGLEKCWRTRAEHLSGGEAQRVALARAVMGQPRFLFLDEPFSALDAGLRAEARSWVSKLIQKKKVPTLLVSHDIQDVEALANQIVQIRDGQMVE